MSNYFVSFQKLAKFVGLIPGMVDSKLEKGQFAEKKAVKAQGVSIETNF